MLFFVFLMLGVLVIVAQTTLLQFFPDWLGRPDFLYILITFAAYRFGWISGMVFVFMLGWMLDVVSGIHPGIYPLQAILIFSFLKLLTENSPLREGAYQVPLVGISYFIVQMGFYFFYSLMMPETLPEWSWNRIIQDTLILLLATIPLFVLLNSLYEILSENKIIHRVISKRSGNQFR